MDEDRNATAAASVSERDPGAGSAPSAAEFDLDRLNFQTVPAMTRRDKRMAWTLGVSGVVAGLTLATGVGVAVLYLIGASPLLAWWALLELVS